MAQSETYSRWLVCDSTDGLYLNIGRRSGGPHARPMSKFVDRKEATPFPTAEAAARCVLIVHDAARFNTLEFVEERVDVRPGDRVADRMPPPRNMGAVPSSWVSATRSMSARDLLDTMRFVEARRVDPNDLAAVKEIFAEVVSASFVPTMATM